MKEIAALILAWFISQGSGWTECGRRYSAEEAVARAEQIAGWVVKYTHVEAPKGREWILAVIAAESGFDSCQVGGWFKKQKGLSFRPTREAVIKAIVGAKGRPIDTGLGQFLVRPGSRERAEGALDPERAIRKLGATTAEHWRYCQGKHPKGIQVRKGVALSCEDAYWAFHNQADFSVKYYRNVKY